MVIFHSYVNVYQRVPPCTPPKKDRKVSSHSKSEAEKGSSIPIPMAFPSPDDKELCAMSRTGDDYIYDVIVYIYI